jgi:hypothetical protein
LSFLYPPFLSSKSLHKSLLLTHVTSVQIAGCFLAAALLDLTRKTYHFSYAVLYDINLSPSTYPPPYIAVVDPILYTWVTVVMFGLLNSIGFRRKNGLWSQEQQPQHQGLVGNSSIGAGAAVAQGQGAPSSLVYILQQQPPQAAFINSAAPAWGTGQTVAGASHLGQQNYLDQSQQQLPFVQDQMQDSASLPTAAGAVAQQYKTVPMVVTTSAL